MALSLSTMPHINTRGGGGTLHMKGVGILIGNFELQCTVVNLIKMVDLHLGNVILNYLCM